MTWEVKFQILLGWVIATMFKTKYKNYKLTKCKKNVGTKTKPNGNPTLDFGVFGLIVVDLIKNKPDHFPVCLFLRMNAVLKRLLGKLTLELNGVLPRMRLQYDFEMDGIPKKAKNLKQTKKISWGNSVIWHYYSKLLLTGGFSDDFAFFMICCFSFNLCLRW